MKRLELDTHGALIEVETEEQFLSEPPREEPLYEPPQERAASEPIAQSVITCEQDPAPVADDVPVSEPRHGENERKRFLPIAIGASLAAISAAALLSVHRTHADVPARRAPSFPPHPVRTMPRHIQKRAHKPLPHAQHRKIVQLAPPVHAPILAPTPPPRRAPPPPLPLPVRKARHVVPAPFPTLPPPPHITSLTAQPNHIPLGALVSLCAETVNARKIAIAYVGQWTAPILCTPLHPRRTTTYHVAAFGLTRAIDHRTITVMVEIPTPKPTTAPTPIPQARRHRHHHNVPLTHPVSVSTENLQGGKLTATMFTSRVFTYATPAHPVRRV